MHRLISVFNFYIIQQTILGLVEIHLVVDLVLLLADVDLGSVRGSIGSFHQNLIDENAAQRLEVEVPLPRIWR